MRVNLTYFKYSGKYYSEGSYETSSDSLLDIWEEVRKKVKEGNLPGLVRGAGRDFYIIVDVPDVSHRHPSLILPLDK